MLGKLLLYARTLRHLRGEQWIYRPVRRLQRLTDRPRPVAWALDEPRAACLAEAVAGWGPTDPDAQMRRAEQVADRNFRFLNHTEVLPEIDWKRRYVSHLWSYNLHYFDYARDLAWAYRLAGDAVFARAFQELAGGWLDQVGSGGGDGWEPYALSVRTTNWTYALLLFGEAIEAPFRRRLTGAIAAQAEFLARRLELHILGNHLQKNLHALIASGLLFQDPAAREMVEAACARLWAEIDEQILPDGCHFERSPMYHALALGDFLEMLSLLDAADLPAPERTRARIRRMVDALGVLCRPAGALHLFNDAAHGIAPPVGWLDRVAAQTVGSGVPMRPGVVSLESGGYYAWSDAASGTRLVVDCGEPGPEYQPGHAHCDLLSYELDLGGRPVVVDSGTSGYGGDPFRAYARSTRAHNTLEIAGREQSEVWGGFRVARRARPLGAEAAADGAAYRFRGSYRPYHDVELIHHREILGDAAGWTVTDRVAGGAGLPVRSLIHLHPDFRVEPGASGLLARCGELSVWIEPFGTDRAMVRRGELQPVQGWYLPEFGRAVPAPVIELQVDGAGDQLFGYRISVVSNS